MRRALLSSEILNARSSCAGQKYDLPLESCCVEIGEGCVVLLEPIANGQVDVRLSNALTSGSMQYGPRVATC